MKIKHRKGRIYGYFNKAKQLIDQKKCPVCGKKHNRHWDCCSKECTAKKGTVFYFLDWPEIRMKAIIRDRFTCVKCGKQLKRKQALLEDDYTFKWWVEHGIIPLKTEEFAHYQRDQKVFYHIVPDDSKYVVDHIIPIALGGKEFNLNNLQTLCEDCNKEKTAIDIMKINIYRNLEFPLMKTLFDDWYEPKTVKIDLDENQTKLSAWI